MKTRTPVRGKAQPVNFVTDTDYWRQICCLSKQPTKTNHLCCSKFCLTSTTEWHHSTHSVTYQFASSKHYANGINTSLIHTMFFWLTYYVTHLVKTAIVSIPTQYYCQKSPGTKMMCIRFTLWVPIHKWGTVQVPSQLCQTLPAV